MNDFETTPGSSYPESEDRKDGSVPYRKSTYSALDNCVEIGEGPEAGLPLDYVGIRDSKTGKVLQFHRSIFEEFLAGIENGEIR